MYINEWFIILALFVLLFFIHQLGFYFGARNNTNPKEGHLTRVANIQAGLMGLLGVMMAFTFSLSSQRFELRRQLIIKESMNIGTSYFRAGLLPDTLRKDLRDLLKIYLNERINFYKAGNTSLEMEEIQNRSEDIQVRIWAKTAVIGRTSPSLNTNLNILALNEMIDTSGNISSSFQSRVPFFIHFLLIFITLCTVLIIGYNNGLSMDKNIPFVIILNVVLCTILLLIADLDTPTSGILRSDIYGLVKLKEEILRYGK